MDLKLYGLVVFLFLDYALAEVIVNCSLLDIQSWDISIIKKHRGSSETDLWTFKGTEILSDFSKNKNVTLIYNDLNRKIFKDLAAHDSDSYAVNGEKCNVSHQVFSTTPFGSSTTRHFMTTSTSPLMEPAPNTDNNWKIILPTAIGGTIFVLALAAWWIKHRKKNSTMNPAGNTDLSSDSFLNDSDRLEDSGICLQEQDDDLVEDNGNADSASLNAHTSADTNLRYVCAPLVDRVGIDTATSIIGKIVQIVMQIIPVSEQQQNGLSAQGVTVMQSKETTV